MTADNDNAVHDNDNLATRPPSADDPVVQVDEHGDPLARGTAMTERESYERVIEGLKAAADAAVHLAACEQQAAGQWNAIARKLDMARKVAINLAGIEDPIRARETQQVRGDPMQWRKGRERFRDGVKQAAGGMRQLAVCFRGDFNWSRMARELEDMQRKMTAVSVSRAARALILPPGYQ